jgi:hypothetical protein
MALVEDRESLEIHRNRLILQDWRRRLFFVMLSPAARFNVGLESGAPGAILAHNIRESHLGQLPCFVATGMTPTRGEIPV